MVVAAAVPARLNAATGASRTDVPFNSFLGEGRAGGRVRAGTYRMFHRARHAAPLPAIGTLLGSLRWYYQLIVRTPRGRFGSYSSATADSGSEMCKPKLCLEVWQGENHCAQDVDPFSLESVILEMASAGSAVLSIVAGQRSLVVSASDGRDPGGRAAAGDGRRHRPRRGRDGEDHRQRRYAVTALLDEDEFFDLIGDSSLKGTNEFVEGGQLVDHPQRHVVAATDAVEAALKFARSGELTPDREWERQGDQL